MENFTAIGKAPAEKSVTMHTYKKERNSKLSIPHYTVYGRITILLAVILHTALVLAAFIYVSFAVNCAPFIK